MLPAKWSDNLKVSFFFSHLLTNANFCMFVRCFKKILNAVTSWLPTIPMSLSHHSTPLESYIADIPVYPCSKGNWEHWMALIFQLTSCFRLGIYRNCKGGISQNVLAATTFECTFATSSVVGGKCFLMGGLHDVHVHDLVIPPGAAVHH